MAVARDLAGKKNNVIAVIGDGAMSAGMAYEAMNNAGAMRLAADRHLERQRHVDRAAGRRHVGLSGAADLRQDLSQAARHRQAARPSPAEILRGARTRAPRSSRAAMVTGGTLFEELGFYYVGPIDGHNLDHLLPVLRNVRDAEDRPDPGARGHAEGQGLRAGGKLGRQISWRGQVRRRHRRAGQIEIDGRRNTPKCLPRA